MSEIRTGVEHTCHTDLVPGFCAINTWAWLPDLTLPRAA